MKGGIYGSLALRCTAFCGLANLTPKVPCLARTAAWRGPATPIAHLQPRRRQVTLQSIPPRARRRQLLCTLRRGRARLAQRISQPLGVRGRGAQLAFELADLDQMPADRRGLGGLHHLQTRNLRIAARRRCNHVPECAVLVAQGVLGA